MSANADPGATLPVKQPQTPGPEATLLVATPPAPARGAGPAAAGGANPDAPVPHLFGHEIARGGMGSILEAEDCKLPRTVAVKIILSEINADEEQKRRFVNEAAVLAKLAHPNIVPVYDIARDADGHVYYSMKLVKGRTLKAILTDVRAEIPEALRHFTLDRLLTIFRKVCDAIAFAHSRGIIHRDLKPENIMVGEFGEVLVMDWGLAKEIGNDECRMTDDEPAGSDSSSVIRHSSFSGTLAGPVMGIPQYMSPEQAAGRTADLDARSDIFSLGGILYGILTLRPPIDGATLDEVLIKVIAADIVSPSAFGASAGRGEPVVKGEVVEAKKIRPLPHCPGGRVPAALSAVAMQALALDKAKRYQNVASLSADIEAWQGGFATSAENAGVVKQLTLLVLRHKALFATALVAWLIITALAVWFVININREKKVAIGERNRAEANEHRAERELNREDALASLKKTAPTFAAQATALVEQGDLEDALEKIGYAVSLDKDNADYLRQQANLLQAAQQLAEAAEGYRAVLALRADAAAKLNLELCEKLLRDNEGSSELKRESQESLVSAMLKQGRAVEAAQLSSMLGQDAGAALVVIQARLKPLAAILGDKYGGTRLQNGTFRLDLRYRNKPIMELPSLDGLPITEVNLDGTKVSDLTPLKGLRLRHLSISGTPVTDLSPLAGMPLESLNIRATKISDLTPLKGMPLTELNLSVNKGVSDLSPLRGMALKKLIVFRTSVADLRPLAGLPIEELNIIDTQVYDLSPLVGMPLTTLIASETKITNLSPLRGMPLHVLELNRTPVSDLSPLAGMPIVTLNLSGTKVTDISVLRTLPLKRLKVQCPAKDLSPLADCKALEISEIPKVTTDISFLRALPNLKRLSDGPAIHGFDSIPTAEQFWQKYDAQRAAPK